MLSRADELQRALLISVPSHVIEPQHQEQLVDLIMGQLGRYEAAGDLQTELETGLSQFVQVEQDDDELTVKLTGSLAQLPPGNGQVTLLNGLAAKYGKLGTSSFGRSQRAVVTNPDAGLGVFDAVALTLYSRSAAR